MAYQTGPVTITGYESKSGNGQRGPWLMHKFKASDGREYTTFDAATAQKAQAAGTNPVILSYEERQKDQYVNYTLLGVQPAGAASPAPVQQTVQAPQAQTDKDQKITRLAAQRTAAQLIGNVSVDQSIGNYRKLVEELILHAETGRWAASAPAAPAADPELPWPEAA